MCGQGHSKILWIISKLVGNELWKDFEKWGASCFFVNTKIGLESSVPVFMFRCAMPQRAGHGN